MKPFEPNMIVYATELGGLHSVNSLNIVLLETDREVQNIKITLEGEDLDYDEINDMVKKLAGAIHSIDLIAAGSSIIESQATPQDKV